MSDLRHPNQPRDTATPTGITTYVGQSAVTGPGITRSCDRCGRHRVQSLGAHIVRQRQPWQTKARPDWYCAACAQERLQRLAAKDGQA